MTAVESYFSLYAYDHRHIEGTLETVNTLVRVKPVKMGFEVSFCNGT